MRDLRCPRCGTSSIRTETADIETEPRDGFREITSGFELKCFLCERSWLVPSISMAELADTFGVPLDDVLRLRFHSMGFLRWAKPRGKSNAA